MSKHKDSVKDIDFSGYTMPMIVVYSNPKDYPGKVVARLYDVEKPTDIVVVKESLREMTKDLAEHSNMLPLGRMPEDDDTVIGVWI